MPIIVYDEDKEEFLSVLFGLIVGYKLSWWAPIPENRLSVLFGFIDD